jgi:hypothetical protein
MSAPSLSFDPIINIINKKHIADRYIKNSSKPRKVLWGKIPQLASKICVAVTGSMICSTSTYYSVEWLSQHIENNYTYCKPSYDQEIVYDDCDLIAMYIDIDKEVKDSEFDQKVADQILYEITSKISGLKLHIAKCHRKSPNGFKYSFKIVSNDILFKSKSDLVIWLYEHGLITLIDLSVYGTNHKVRMIGSCKGTDKHGKFCEDSYYQTPFESITKDSKAIDFFITGQYRHWKTFPDKNYEIDHTKNKEFESKIRTPKTKSSSEAIIRTKGKSNTIVKKSNNLTPEPKWDENSYKFYDQLLSKFDVQCFTDLKSWQEFVWAIASKGKTDRALELVKKYSSLAPNYDEKSVEKWFKECDPTKMGIKHLFDRSVFKLNPSKNPFMCTNESKLPEEPITDNEMPLECMDYPEEEPITDNDFEQSLTKFPFKIEEVETNSLDKISFKSNPKFILIESQTGTGKSKKMYQFADCKSFVFIDSRISIAEEHRAKLEDQKIYPTFYSDTKVKMIDQSKVIITLNSLHRIDPKVNFETVFLDEVNSLLEHLVGKTIKDKRETYKLLYQVCHRANHVIMCDATITNNVMDFIMAICDGQVNDVLHVRNKYVWDRKEQIVFVKDFKHIIKMIHDDVGKCKMFIPCDTKRKAREIEIMIKRRLVELGDYKTQVDNFYVGSKSRIEKFGYSKQVVEHKQTFDPSFKKYADIIICSPKITYGISMVDEDYKMFDKTYAIYLNTTIDSFGKMQQISRYRNDCPVFIYSSFNREIKPKYKTYDETVKYYTNLYEAGKYITRDFEDLRYLDHETDDNGSINLNVKSIINKISFGSLLYREKSLCYPDYFLCEELLKKGYKFGSPIEDKDLIDYLDGSSQKINLDDAENKKMIINTFIEDPHDADTKKLIDQSIGKPLLDIGSYNYDKLTKDNINYIYDIAQESEMISLMKMMAGIKQDTSQQSIPEYLKSNEKKAKNLKFLNDNLNMGVFDGVNDYEYTKVLSDEQKKNLESIDFKEMFTTMKGFHIQEKYFYGLDKIRIAQKFKQYVTRSLLMKLRLRIKEKTRGSCSGLNYPNIYMFVDYFIKQDDYKQILAPVN